MDFFQFLQNSRDIPNSKQDKTTKKKTKEIETRVDDDNCKTSTNLKNEELETYKNISKGDIVKIIGVKGSILNSYKGYIGEVKDYKRDKDSAMIFLQAITYQTIVRFPLYHFIKIDPYRKEELDNINLQD